MNIWIKPSKTVLEMPCISQILFLSSLLDGYTIKSLFLFFKIECHDFEQKYGLYNRDHCFRYIIIQAVETEYRLS